MTFFCLVVAQSLLLEMIVIYLSFSLHFFLLPFPIISYIHQELCSLTLPLDSIQDLSLVPLQYIESTLERLQHARVFVLNPLSHNQRIEFASPSSVKCQGVPTVS